MRKKINTVIVDDEPGCIACLSADLAGFADIQVVQTATTAEMARRLVVKHQPDLLFLDIQMPEINGLDLLKEIRPQLIRPMQVVFYTAYDKYLLDMLRASAFDCLLKPYLPEELELVIGRVRLAENGKNKPFDWPDTAVASWDRKLAFQTLTGLRLLRREEVLFFYFSDDLRCWQMVLTDHSTHKLRGSIKARDLLGICGAFIQISQDCIINADYLFSVGCKTLECRLRPPFDTIKLTVSRKYYSQMKELLDIL